MSKNFKQFIKDTEYTITNKTRNLDNFTMQTINKLQSMFEYKGLPDTIPAKWLEFYLMCNGNCFVTKVDGNLYCFTGGLGGEPNAYYQPTKYVVANPYLKLSKEYEIDKDGVLVRNDTMLQGMLPLIKKYGVLLTETDITIRSALINLRTYNIISASDDDTKKSADEFLKHIENGELASIGSNPFFEGIKVANGQNSTNYLTQVIEMTQYLKASFYNEIGLNANYNLKREYISQSENTLADDVLLPLVDNMLTERKEGLKKINNMYGTNISVDFSSSWKANNTENSKEISDNETAISDDKDESMSDNNELNKTDEEDDTKDE